MAIKLTTGKEAFPIEFDNGDKEVIYFNPNDPGLASKMKDFEKNCKEKIGELKDEDMLPKDESISEGIRVIEENEKISEIICEELDNIFGDGTSNVLFKYCSPLATVNGEYYMLVVLSALKDEIEKRVKKSTELTKKNMEKYMRKYGR